MTWKIKQKLRLLLQAENNLCENHSGRGGTLSVCLVYPNNYHTAMSSLGFQTIYRILNDSDGIHCERAFLPDNEDCQAYAKSGAPLMSIETERPLCDFDVVAFSTSFEPDYIAIPRILLMGKIPPLASERGDSHPLIIAGGAAFFINPEPVADFLDLICIGEGEVLLPDLLSVLTSKEVSSHKQLLHSLAKINGVYVPCLYPPCNDITTNLSINAIDFLPPFQGEGRGGDGVFSEISVSSNKQSHPHPNLPLEGEGTKNSKLALMPCNEVNRFKNSIIVDSSISRTVTRVCADPAATIPAHSVILTENTEFNDMFLIEISRGCPRGCRFCTSGFVYSPFRHHPLQSIVPLIDEGLKHCSKIGLVGAAVSDHPDFHQLCSYVVGRGGKVSVSSLRIDRIGGEALQALKTSGHKTISLAPEGPSQRLRDLIKKNLTRNQILETCQLLISEDILNLRLYFIIGLPTETMDDLEEMVSLVTEIRGRVVEAARANRRLGEIILSVNPFIPKPFTPFQWCGMEPLPSLEKKVKFLENKFRPLSNIRLKVEGLKECYLQALLSRGDRRLTPLLLEMSKGIPLKKAARDCHIDTPQYVNRNIPLNSILPWDTIKSGESTLLENEFKKAFGVVKQ